jgi:hypothetical protein
LINLWYFIFIIDESIRYCRIEVINTRTAKALVDLIKSFIGRIQRQYNKIKFWRTNNIKEFISDFFQSLLKYNHIKWEHISSYIHY